VANLSLKYALNGLKDPIKSRISGLGQNTLFVVAAGNDKIKISPTDGCSLFPACYHNLENVVTVVGVDRSDPPKLWMNEGENGSNSNPAFSLAAVADSIVSTAQGDHIGAMSGTSQAAPQVAAAASLIHSRFETQFAVSEPVLLPIRVKNRLIYTSDLSNTLLTASMGGRLNVQRALDMATDRVRLKTATGGEVEYVGRVVDFDKNNDGLDFIECINADASRTQFQFRNIRRLHYDTVRRKYVMFYNSVPGDRNSALVRKSDCGLNTLNNIATMQADGSDEDVTFKLRHIRDYTSSMY